MRKMTAVTLMVVSLVALSVPAFAAVEALPFRASPGDMYSVRQGAREFVNYCAGCHTMKYLRYSRLGEDAGISKNALEKNLIFPVGLKTTSHLVNGMKPAEAKNFFGKAPPDLTLEAEFRGVNWIYNYLHSFYLDPKRPTGVNSTMIKNVAMPDVMWQLQGWQKKKPNGNGGSKLVSVSKGSMTPAEYDKFVTDLVNFMAYAATPEQPFRALLGPFVLVFLLVLTALFYLVKHEFWKDVHDS